MVDPVIAAVAGAVVVLAIGAVLYAAYLKGRVDKSNEWSVVNYNDILQYKALNNEVGDDQDGA